MLKRLPRTLIAAALCLTAPVPAQESATTQPADDSLAPIRKLDNGLVTVDSLDLPREFLRHVLESDLRARFRSIYHRVGDNPASNPPHAGNAAPGHAIPLREQVIDIRLPQQQIDAWVTQPFAVPNLRGFRAMHGTMHQDPWPADVIAQTNRELYQNAARYVAHHLAHDGLIRTTANVMRLTPELNWTRGGALNLTRLRGIGIPIDLLSFFRLNQAPITDALAAWYDAGASPSTIQSLATRAEFAFQPSCPGFRVMLEDGSEPINALRFQLPTNQFVLGEGDGSVLDVVRQIAQHLPDQRLMISIHRDGMESLLHTMQGWNIPKPQRLMIVPHPANITQWAQDNAKAGRALAHGPGEAPRVVTLIPRYASRTELRTQSLPSDSFVFESLARGGMDVVQSPLLFQGGNLLPVTDPRSGKRMLMIGEAEVYRNRALGLSPAQVFAAFAGEFGVDICEVLPAVSFHLDLDVTIRMINGEVIACVNDDLAGGRIVAREGVEALASAGFLRPAEVEAVQTGLGGRDTVDAIAAIWKAIAPLKQEGGEFTADFAAAFERSKLESGPANARRFLAAIDILTAATIPPERWPQRAQSTLLMPYMESIRYHEQERAFFVHQLQKLGFRVHRVPGLCDQDVSMSYVNGLHLQGMYAMPAHGGMYRALDDAAAHALQSAFGTTVKMERFNAAVMQLHDGGLHCLAGLYPAPVN